MSERLPIDYSCRTERAGLSSRSEINGSLSFGRILFSSKARRTSSGSGITSRPARIITSNTKYCSGVLDDPKFCKMLNDGHPLSSSAITSPSMTVSSGNYRRISDTEVVVVSGAQVDPATGLEWDADNTHEDHKW